MGTTKNIKDPESKSPTACLSANEAQAKSSHKSLSHAPKVVQIMRYFVCLLAQYRKKHSLIWFNKKPSIPVCKQQMKIWKAMNNGNIITDEEYKNGPISLICINNQDIIVSELH